jgi:hypothetical protein
MLVFPLHVCLCCMFQNKRSGQKFSTKALEKLRTLIATQKVAFTIKHM